MKNKDHNPGLSKSAAILIAGLLPMISFGANTRETVFANPLFNTLLAVIILLAIIIVSLGGALRSLISSDFYVEKLKKQKSGQGNKMALLLILTGASLSMNGMTAATEDVPEVVSKIGGLDYATFYTMITIIAAEVLVTGILVYTFRTIAGEQERKKAVPVKKAKPVLDVLNKTVPIEEEERITLDHVYDGIRELDNDLPPWWKYGFYLTIVVSVVYMVAYHVTDSLPLQAEEYKASVKKGEAEVAAFMKTSASNVDETTVKLLTEKSDLDAGKDIFIASCAACHGRAGEGGVGPNLTDDYWIHKGGVSDIFKTIKYGSPDKGMKAWKDDFSPIQIAQLSSFIKTLRGSNPANAKEKQGELYSETIPATDSLKTKNDTINKLTTQVLEH